MQEREVDSFCFFPRLAVDVVQKQKTHQKPVVEVELRVADHGEHFDFHLVREFSFGESPAHFGDITHVAVSGGIAGCEAGSQQQAGYIQIQGYAALAVVHRFDNGIARWALAELESVEVVLAVSDGVVCAHGFGGNLFEANNCKVSYWVLRPKTTGSSN